MPKKTITVARGDGIGPEIMEATLFVLKEAGAEIDYEEIEVGEKVYLAGHKAGIEPHAWESIFRTQTLLKAPITTPQGGGYRSLNVTIRSALGLYANVRPCVAYAPFVKTKHPGMDLVIVRENEEDLYSGIEYHQTPDTYHSIKIISRPASERIIHYAFEYAKANGRQKVTCFTKDNIMKWSDGLFHKVFDEVAADYPEIENEHWIVDIGAAKLADTPENFDLLVLPNLYGDILSDVAAQIAGSVGLAGSANIGERGAMFEAIHGSAPRRAGQNLANPSGLMLAAVQLLVHIGQPEAATRMHNAWLKTIEDGIHTYDIYDPKVSKEKVGTKEFAKAIVQRVGQEPHTLKSAHYAPVPSGTKKGKNHSHPVSKNKELVGVDLYFQSNAKPKEVVAQVEKISAPPLHLALVTNRGGRVWPEGSEQLFCIDQWRCRYLADGKRVTAEQIIDLQRAAVAAGCDLIKTENLYHFDGKPAYS